MKARLKINISVLFLYTFILFTSTTYSFNIIDNDSVMSFNTKAVDIVNKVIDKYNSSITPIQYGKALYRQKSKNDESYSEFAEIIYDVQFDNDAIIDWDIIESRYAYNDETINNKNFTLLSKVIRVFQPKSKALIFPLTNEFTQYYKVKVINNNDEFVTINFRPLNSIKTPIINANVTINTLNYQVTKVEGSLKNDDIKIVSFSNKTAVKKNYTLNFEISYKKDDIFGYVLDYINLNHEFDYLKKNKHITHLYAASSLNFFEYYNKKPKKEINPDKPAIIGYKKSFWDNNPIIKRTAIDNEIIGNFEQLNAFRSLFINDKEQISINSLDVSKNPVILNVNNYIRKHYTNNLTQKVFLHTNKNKYSKDNKIYYSAFVTSENADTTFNKKDVLYVDLINGKDIIDSKVIKIRNGTGNGTFAIDKKYRPGNYKVVAYTNYMKNFSPNKFFIKDIEIGDPSNGNVNEKNDNTLLRFYPEGGQIINGISNRVAYKAQNSNGVFKDINGKIIDSDGEFITILKSKYEGLGFFYLKPKKDKSYAIILDDGRKYPIPYALNTGYSIMTENINARTMTVNIRSTSDIKSDKIYVIGIMDNKKYYQGGFTFEDKDVIRFEIPKSKLPSGIMDLVILNSSQKVIGSRSIYINKNDGINLEAQIDKTYIDNEFIKLKIKTTNNISSISNISLSIAKQLNDKPNNINDNLISHFKLPSFSKDGRITKFINKNDRVSSYKLDLMMLTNEPSDFSWLEKSLNYDEKKYQHEKGISITGIAKDKDDYPLTGKKLKLLTKNKYRIWEYETKTDKNGMFTIHDFEEVDTTALEFRTYYKTHTSKYKQIYSTISLSKKGKFKYLDQLTFDEKYVSSISNKKYQNRYNSAFSKEGELLETVELKAKKVRTKTDNRDLFRIKPDVTIDEESLLGGGLDIVSAMSRVTGVTIRLVKDEFRVLIRGGSPLWIVDGMEMEGIPNIMMSDVERIEVIKMRSKMSVYGPRVSKYGGIIMVYYKRYEDDIETSAIDKIIYNSPEEFNYENKNDDTLYWNPLIKTDENGYIDVLFKKPSSNIKFINVNIQAINKNGEIGYLNKVIKLQ